jgi:hypothetical protein
MKYTIFILSALLVVSFVQQASAQGNVTTAVNMAVTSPVVANVSTTTAPAPSAAISVQVSAVLLTLSVALLVSRHVWVKISGSRSSGYIEPLLRRSRGRLFTKTDPGVVHMKRYTPPPLSHTDTPPPPLYPTDTPPPHWYAPSPTLLHSTNRTHIYKTTTFYFKINTSEIFGRLL